MFIGGNSSKRQSSEYEDFKENEEYSIILSHLAYIPRCIICAKAEVEGNQIFIENKIPHITLLLCNAVPKYSNEVLSQIKSFKDVSVTKTRDGKSAYCVKLSRNISYKGVSKYFY